MSSDTSTNLQLPYVMPAQAQKHVTVNEVTRRLDAIVHLSVVTATLSAQPASPADGTVYILPAGKTGADWGDYADHGLAYYRDGAWEQLRPLAGWRAWVSDEARALTYTGSTWIDEVSDLRENAAALGTSVIDNGAFEVDQLAGPWTTGGAIIDRWGLTTDNGEITVTRQDLTPGDVPGCRHALRMVVGGANSDVRLAQVLDVPLRNLADRALLVSFWAKSDVSTGLALLQGRRNWGSGEGQNSTTLQDSFTLSSTWTQFWEVFNVGDMSSRTFGAGHSAQLIWFLQPNTAQTIEMTGFQAVPWDPAVAKPASPPPFTPRPLAVEWAACQRYRQVIASDGVEASRPLANVACYEAEDFRGIVTYPRMHASPTVTFEGDWELRINGLQPAATLSAVRIMPDGFELNVSASGGGVAVGDSGWVRADSDTTARMILEA